MKLSLSLIIVAALLGSASACPIDSGGHYTKLTFLDIAGKGDLIPPISNQTVYVTPVKEEYVSLWMQWFGVMEEIEEDFSNTTIYITNEEGAMIIPMYEAIKYNVTILNKTYYLHPNENEYIFFLR